MSQYTTKLYDFDPDAQPEDEATLTVAHVDEPHDLYGGRQRRGSSTDHLGEVNPTKKGWLGNPHLVSEHGRETAIDLFERSFMLELRGSWAFANALIGLPGQVVACHCRHTHESEPACHLDVVREKLLDGTVFGIAHHCHDISMPEWMRKKAKPAPEVDCDAN